MESTAVDLCHRPTPLEIMPRLRAEIGGPELWVKRDDCTGLAGGGNKTRKLELLIADALARGCDSVITYGAVQSNHVRQTAAAAAKEGLACWGLLERRVPETGEAYELTGNAWLTELLGARVMFFVADHPMDEEAEALADRLRGEGWSPYVIPGGGSNDLGALAYVTTAEELMDQLAERGLDAERCLVVTASGSGGTHAGLVAGLAQLGSPLGMLGISVRQARADQEALVGDLAEAVYRRAGGAGTVDRTRVVVDDGHVGPGYGILTEGAAEAVRLCARREGLLIDPVYTGKAMAGLIAYARAGRFADNQAVVFLHTGGAQSLFAYPSLVENGATARAPRAR